MAGRRRTVVSIFAGAILLAFFTTPALAVDSATLVEQAKRYDGKAISFIGEAIGDVMERPDGAWININDDAYSRQGQTFKLAGFNSGQSVLAAKADASKIKRLGDYDNRGDTVAVRGVFHAACPDHGGDMMIHADSLEVIRNGFPLQHPISARKIELLLTWLAISGAVLAAWRWRPRAR